MLNTGGVRLTTAGRNLYARAITENLPITITRIVVGDGELVSDWEELTDVINPLFEIAEIYYKVVGEDIAQITFDYTSQTEPAGFVFREFGVFAEHPELGEVMYAYENAGEYADHVAPASTFRFTRNIKKILVKIANASQVILQIDLIVPMALENIIDQFTSTEMQTTFPLIHTSPRGALSVILEGAETLDFTVAGNSVVLDYPVPAGIRVWIKEVRTREDAEMSA